MHVTEKTLSYKKFYNGPDKLEVQRMASRMTRPKDLADVNRSLLHLFGWPPNDQGLGVGWQVCGEISRLSKATESDTQRKRMSSLSAHI